ncbi:hypothetical protein O3P69_016384 [Scylla paramamosain]|uniref:Peptide-N(4)-(N-acetyl-beta-glucosaminyl)asparagine amidase n=2 Tax=Scylla paramamosain TaxID=85552 RepID=A0AAW0TFJ2_SCYPA
MNCRVTVIYRQKKRMNNNRCSDRKEGDVKKGRQDIKEGGPPHSLPVMTELSSCVESLLENDPELAEGAVDVLMKAGDKLILPQSDPLDNLRLYREQLMHLKTDHLKKAACGTQQQSTVNTLPVLMASETEVKSNLVSNFERVLVYESPALQEKARQLLPEQRLHELARNTLSSINKDIGEKEKPLDFQDCLLIQLLEWFKNSFFTWFDCPSCPMCHKNMTMVGSLPPTEDDLVWGGSRVEGYACSSCNTSERFARYNHPGKLLETRRGRCGEWANCFTLLCRTLGMDARYVLDFTDHVWTEVYSQSQGRWLHADCCENKLDSPLMYECGWGKKLTYIFAFSKDEVVDVTWRYTSKQKEVMKRRNKCREKWLVSTLLNMNKKRQETYAPTRKNFLELRLVAETAQFLGQNHTVKESEKQGRSSGSLAWRLSRGETQAASVSGYTFHINSSEEMKKEFVVKYSPAQDQYIRLNAEEAIPKGWQSGVNAAKNISRKREADWKMVYLCRTEGSPEGEVSWVFDWSHTNLKVTSALVVFQHTTYEDGCVDWQLCTGDVCVSGPKEGVLELTKDVLERGAKKLELSAVLTKGQGDVAWQHAQLFRQPDSSTEFPFYVRLRFG